MNKFLYKAQGPSGKIVTGTVMAKDEIEAQALLSKHNLSASQIAPTKADPFDFMSLFSKVNSKDRAVFARQLSTMISAGLTLPKAIKVTSSQARTKKLQEIYQAIYKDLEEGRTFSDALSRHPNAFDAVFVSVVAAGESTGKLDVVLNQLAQQLENDNNFTGKVKGALYYPGFVLLVLVAIATYMMIKVVPALKGIFDQQGAQLPIATRMLLGLSDWLQDYWWLALALIIGLAAFIKFFFGSESGSEIKDNLQLKTPGLNKLFEGIYMYRLTKILSMLLSAGVPLLNAVRIASSTLENHLYSEGLLNVAKYVERGVPLSTQILKEPVFPAIIGQMAAVGEETGQLDGVLAKVSDYFQETTDQMIKTLSTLIEPAILILVGAAVAFVVFAVLVPIYNFAGLM